MSDPFRIEGPAIVSFSGGRTSGLLLYRILEAYSGESLIRQKRYLPNPVTRFCTTEMKVRPMKLWAQQTLGWRAWTVVIGLRADEQRRVAKLSIPAKEPFDRIAPLATAGVTKADVSAFWRAQPFDLRLPNDNGTTPLGNCDLCYLKGYTRITSILRDRPELGKWWARMEREVAGGDAVTGLGETFRKDRPSYAVMMKQVRDQATIGIDDEPIGDCFCVE